MTLRWTPQDRIGVLGAGMRVHARAMDSAFQYADVAGLEGYFDLGIAAYTDTGLTTLAANDGDAIAGLYDLSGNGNHVTQGTAGNKPVLKLNIKNGRAVGRFDGGDFLSAGDKMDLLTDDMTVFAVAVRSSGDFAPFAKSLAAGYPGRFGMFGTGGNLVGIYHNDTGHKQVVAAYTSTAWDLLELHLHRSLGYNKLFVNGAEAASTTFTAESTSYDTAWRFLIGAYNNGDDSGQYFYHTGDIGLLLNYHAAITGTNLTNIRAKINADWAMY